MQTLHLNVFEKKIPLILTQHFIDEQICTISKQNLLFTLTVLKKHINYQYKLLTCISGVDLLKDLYRFSLVYELLSINFNCRIRVKIFTNEATTVNTSTQLYINADWWEREIWDMYGVFFSNNESLHRILTDYGFEGYPLRKDFPLSGFDELRYDLSKKRVLFEPIELTQEFRCFTFENKW